MTTYDITNRSGTVSFASLECEVSQNEDWQSAAWQALFTAGADSDAQASWVAGAMDDEGHIWMHNAHGVITHVLRIRNEVRVAA